MMGSAESNMDIFAKRLKKNGYSWLDEGINTIGSAVIHNLEGTLLEAVKGIEGENKENRKIYLSLNPY